VYYVLGQVDRPGPKSYTGRDLAIRAIAEANPNAMAWGDRIQVIRPSEFPGVKPRIFELKWDPMVAHGDASNDVLLQEGDIIFVPPTILAGIALKLENFLRQSDVLSRLFGLLTMPPILLITNSSKGWQNGICREA